jgi:hypothetical protein
MSETSANPVRPSQTEFNSSHTRFAGASRSRFSVGIEPEENMTCL